MVEADEDVPTAPWWMWTLLSLIAAASFWCQAILTEERYVPFRCIDVTIQSRRRSCRLGTILGISLMRPLFILAFHVRLVPALNVIADYFKIPSDIAGATLMAAGASSPELFSSFVSLFITHSSLGLGTIVGSEIFNQLIICAGSVYASKTGKLVLDRAIVTREVAFYALGIVLLYVALQDARPLDSDPDGPDYIFISFWESCLVFGGYILYVLVCANMDAVVSCVTWTRRGVGERLAVGQTASYGSIKRVVRILRCQ